MTTSKKKSAKKPSMNTLNDKIEKLSKTTSTKFNKIDKRLAEGAVQFEQLNAGLKTMHDDILENEKVMVRNGREHETTLKEAVGSIWEITHWLKEYTDTKEKLDEMRGIFDGVIWITRSMRFFRKHLKAILFAGTGLFILLNFLFIFILALFKMDAVTLLSKLLGL